MKRLAVISLLALLPLLPVRAAEPLRVGGVVLEEGSDNPVIGAVVRLDKDYLWAVTDADGRFSLEKVQQGTYTLEVSCLGYVTETRQFSVKRDLPEITVRLLPESLAIEEVVVTAEKSKDNINTTQTIGRTALDHLQMNSMGSITALLPGGKTLNPDLTSDNSLSLRSAGSTVGNAAFSTAVEINGVRMGDNASFGEMGGVGTRSLSVENIESVEVITGVPSAEYGDLGSGMVKVNTKKGRTPLNISFSVNPRTYEASVSKGFEVGQGVINLGAEWARATKKLTSPYTSYTRRGITLDYTRTFNKVLRLEAGLNGNLGGMNTESDPDAFSDEFTKERDNLLTPHLKLTWLLNRSWVTNLTLEASAYYHDRRSHVHAYHSTAEPMPAVHTTEKGYSTADMLPATYYSDQVTDSRELDFAASLKYHWLKHWGASKNLIKAGVQWKADGNVGEGEYFLNPALADNGYRPRPYRDYPYMHTLASYLEDNLTLPIGRTTLNLMAGLRWEKAFVAGTDYKGLSILSPRLNAKWSIGKNLDIRGGWGIAGKLPSFYILFPRQEYRDILSQTRSTAEGKEYTYYTQPYTMVYNPDLRWQKNYNSEVGVDARVKGFSISVVGFYNKTKDPYQLGTVYEPFSFQRMGIKDYTFAASRQQENGADVHRYGVELTVDCPEIKAIGTTFRLDAAWNHSHYTSDIPVYMYREGWSHTTLANRSYQYVGIYAGSTSVSNGRRTDNVDANLTAITHIPRARLIITLRLEASLLRNTRNTSDRAFTVGKDDNTPTDGNIYDGNSYTAVTPIAYMDLDGDVHGWTDACAQDPGLSRLIQRSGNIYTFAQDGYDPYCSANLSVTKEIGKHVSLSFFANNFTNARAFVRSHATGVSAIFTPNFYYGLTCRIKL